MDNSQSISTIVNSGDITNNYNLSGSSSVLHAKRNDDTQSIKRSHSKKSQMSHKDSRKDNLQTMSTLLKKRHQLNGQTLQQQITQQASIRTQDNKYRHVKILKNIIKEARKNRKQKAVNKKLDKRQNTFLKRAQKMHTTFQGQKSKTMVTSEAISSDDDEDNEDNENEEMHFLSQKQQKQSASMCIVLPDNQWKQLWDFFMILIVLSQAILVPFNLCFIELNSILDTEAELVFDVIFFLDMFLTFNCGYYEKGLVNLNRTAITQKYLKNWFLIDLLSALPYSYLVDAHIFKDTTSDAKQIFRYIRLLRAFKFTKYDIQVSFKSFEFVVTDQLQFATTMIKNMVVIFFIAHWMACFYWKIGLASLTDQHGSWIIAGELLEESVYLQYVTSLYWAFQTMVTVGYGDVTPVSNIEQIYVMLSMLLAAGVYAYTLNNIGNMVSRYNILAVQYREKMVYVNQFMIQQKLPVELRHRVTRYLQYVWEMKKQIKIEQDQVFELLNENLREKITVCMNGIVLQTIPFFETFNMEFVSEMTFHLRSETYAMDDNIFVEGQQGDCIYFIQSGRCAVIHRKSLTYLDELIRDDYFGELAFFSQLPRCTTVKSRDFTDLFIIDLEVFNEVGADYDDVMGLYWKINNQLNDGNYTTLKVECYLCKKMGHIALECNYFDLHKGNLIQIYNKVTRRKTDSLSPSMYGLQQKLKFGGGTGKKNTAVSMDYKKQPKKSILKKGDNFEESGDFEGDYTPTPDEFRLNDQSEDFIERENSSRTNINSERESNRQLIDGTRKSRSRLSQLPMFEDNSEDFSPNGRQSQYSSNRRKSQSTLKNKSIEKQDSSNYEESESSTDSPAQQREQQSPDRQREKSLLYEKLKYGLREDCINETIPEEQSSFTSDSQVDMEENKEEEEEEVTSDQAEEFENSQQERSERTEDETEHNGEENEDSREGNTDN